MTSIFISKSLIKKTLALILIFFIPSFIRAQATKDTVVTRKIKSLPEIFKKKDTVLSDSKKTNFFIVIPLIGSQPATGFAFGAVGQYTFKGKNEEDRYSTLNLGATYTEKKQLIVNFKNSVMLRNNKIFLSGDWRYYKFSQANFGLGSDIIPSIRKDKNFEIASIEEPMQYNYFKFHQTISWKINGDFYIGSGIHLDSYSSIIDENLNVESEQFTNHFLYNSKNGFNDKEYSVNGLSLNLIFDSRDNQINTNHGWFGNINYRMNPSLNKNQNASSMLFAEYRYFIPLSKTNEQYVFSIWTYGQFVTSGKVPYLNLPAIGWDQRSRSGKGYIQGLFRGYNLTYLEAEYRFPISRNQLISGTIFTNFTSTSDKDRDVRLFQYIQPAIGVGLRILIDKATRTNLVLNYAFGNQSKAFYLNAGESF
jgi:hypothetical protein